MKKLLYIDPQCPGGHVNFNGIWIRALTESGTFDVTLALSKDYESLLDYDRRKCRFVEVPASWIPSAKGRAIGQLGRWILRLRRIVCLRKLLEFLRPQDYDVVVFSSFDTPVAFFAPVQSHVVWVGHNLAEQVRQHRIFRAMLRRLGKQSHLVGLGRYVAEALRGAGIPNVLEIPHGFPAPFPSSPATTGNLSLEIFAPVKTHYDKTTLSALFSKSMSALLDEVGLRIVVRVVEKSSNNIHLVKGRIPDGEYVARMTSSKAILIFYQDGYERNSMTLLEAMLARRPVLVRKIPCFAHLEGTPGLRFFSSQAELEQQIRDLAFSAALPDYRAVENEENPEKIPQVLETILGDKE